MTDARLARESVLVAEVEDASLINARLARGSTLVAHIEAGASIAARMARMSILVMQSRGPHGWDVYAAPTVTHQGVTYRPSTR